MGLFLKRLQRWVDAAYDWLGFKTRKILTTNPPPMGPRLAKSWQHAWDDEETTPDLRRRSRPRHARPRPPKHDRGGNR